MNNPLLNNLFDPPVLFFFFGVFVAAIRSNLQIPDSISKFLSLYLLMSIGFKGGQALAKTGFQGDMLLALSIAMFIAFAVPAYTFFILKNRTGVFNAAAVAATYGSVSAVTFIAASQFLINQGETFNGYMAVALVLMESPAIIMAVLLANWARHQQATAVVTGTTSQAHSQSLSIKNILHEAFTDGAHLLLLGSMLIGAITGEHGKKVMDPFTGDIFKGMLGFFLLDMGIKVAQRIRDLPPNKGFLLGFGIVMPVLNGCLAVLLTHLVTLPMGDEFLLVVLAASASYIVVPAVVRYAIPEANPSLYFGLSLGITFPFNIVIGIPLYYSLVKYFN